MWKARELEILRLLAEGLTDSEIGVRLHLASDTIRWYNKHIYEKLGVGNRTQAVSQAASRGLLERSAAPLESAHPAAKSAIQYAANGDVHLAYQVVGDGPVDLLFINGFVSHLELIWEVPHLTSFFDELGSLARVILFDKRGNGLSDRIQGAPTLENTVDDACCVLDTVGSRRAFVMGVSEGGAAATLLAATYPGRVQGLILYGTSPKFVRTDNEPHWAMPEAAFERAIELMLATWGQPYAIEYFAPQHAHDERLRALWSRLLRAAASPSSLTAIFNTVRDVDLRPLLPDIHTRTLVLHKTGDQVIRVGAGRYIAEHLPEATWGELPGSDHFYFFDYAPMIEAISQFLSEWATAEALDTALATILYLMADGGMVITPEIETAVSSYRGRHLAALPYGFMALFDGPTRAVRCALRLREMALPSDSRIALHVGECRMVGGKPTGKLVQVVQQMVQHAAHSDILISRPLRDILAGSGFVFEARDDSNAIGMPLYAAHAEGG